MPPAIDIPELNCELSESFLFSEDNIFKTENGLTEERALESELMP